MQSGKLSRVSDAEDEEDVANIVFILGNGCHDLGVFDKVVRDWVSGTFRNFFLRHLQFVDLGFPFKRAGSHAASPHMPDLPRRSSSTSVDDTALSTTPRPCHP